MNIAYQLVLSTSDILVATLFVALAKKARLGTKKIRITPILATGNEIIRYGKTMQANSESELMKILATMGVTVKGTGRLRSVSSNYGVIYHSNMAQMKKILASCRNIKIRIFNKNVNAIQRQLYAGNAMSGLIMAYQMDRNIEVI